MALTGKIMVALLLLFLARGPGCRHPGEVRNHALATLPSYERHHHIAILLQGLVGGGLRSKPYFKYIVRLGTVMGTAGFFGTVLGFTSTVARARREAAAMADEALLNRATLAGFQQTRYMTQKHIWSRALMTGTKFAIFSGLLSGIELGMSYYRGYWDAWNPLLAGTGAGILYALPTMGLRGIQMGAAIGGALAMPYTLAQIAMRHYVSDDDLMPSVVLFADVPDVNMKGALSNQLIKEAEIEKELDKLDSKSPKLR